MAGTMVVDIMRGVVRPKVGIMPGGGPPTAVTMLPDARRQVGTTSLPADRPMLPGPGCSRARRQVNAPRWVIVRR